MQNDTLTDDEKERIAIAVEHLEPDEAQDAYDKQCEQLRDKKGE